MYNQTEAIVAQYELEVRGIAKGRDCFLCETDRGGKVLCPFRGSPEKGERIKKILEDCDRQGFAAERIETSRTGAAVTVDALSGERFWLKERIAGRELNPLNQEEVKKGAACLGRFHKAAGSIESEEVPEMIVDVPLLCQRHTKELLKTRNYIRGRKKKQEFEQIYLRYFDGMYETAEKSCLLLEEGQAGMLPRSLCHGDCNHHNLLWTEDGVRLINYENLVYAWQIWDLAAYLRKMMEKNRWEEGIGRQLLLAYERERALSEEERRLLSALVLFPEKFWKAANHYMSAKKAWIPEKDVEKLRKTIEQEILRLKFVQNLFEVFPKP